MTQPIDTSPAALCKLATHPSVMFTDEVVRRQISPLLLAIAAEKEAQAKQEPVAWTTKSGIARFIESGVGALTAYKKHCTPAKECQSVPLYLVPQLHPEQPREMVAPADVPLPSHCQSVYREGWIRYTEEAMRQYAEAYANAAAVLASQPTLKGDSNG